MGIANCLCRDLTEKCRHCSPKCFRDLWLFRNFSEEEYSLLQSIGRLKVFSRGQLVFLQGTPSDEMFLIKAGRIKLSKYLPDGSEVILDFRKSGELFGENAFIGEELFPMNAAAMEETITCGAKRSDLESLILRHPRIGITMLGNMSERIQNLSIRVENMAIGNLEERLFQILCHIAKEHGSKMGTLSRIAFPLTHEDLGFLASAHRVSVTKALSRLLKSGRVIRKGKMYSLPGDHP